MSLLQALTKSFFPAKCATCQCYIESPGLCTSCHQSLPLFDHTDQNLLLRPDINRMFNLPNCDGLSACGWYHGQLATWVKQVKYQHSRQATMVLRQVIDAQWHRLKLQNLICADGVILVPLPSSRLIYRGYNQVYQMWAPMLKQHNANILNTIGKRSRPSHVSLSKQARQNNAKQAFYLKQTLEHKRILIIDDVITSGATVNAIAALCKSAGAQSVWACATCITEL
ncbi:ComF family protein [Pseudoalteromonas luteoviolacea]|uniref:Putative amidophosphoribosyltransferase n=1 Tax=Pseudoalteromonas luteoviolacea (strain 2ta16) TaxID=1353533 RepID=V4HM16_PSEL2|nr:phosphoribosyltransferase family protein [Pseudoalteromonas luteoviolacea]ESP91850.1 putative amidophosphoribosyltransferase [Pseudoalteromonas luteoviolacea 2ta16]KZN42901.1 hypothetical protein N483_11060 [Pseudoalteromonas luteoviolacea NCIMB 1944]